MSSDKAILSILVGITAIVIGFTVKQFYASNQFAVNSNKPIPRWAGRLLFVGIGVVFFAVGVAYFFSDH